MKTIPVTNLLLMLTALILLFCFAIWDGIVGQYVFVAAGAAIVGVAVPADFLSVFKNGKNGDQK